MMFRRRGCLLGCGSFLLLGIVAILLIWFVAIPRVSDVFEDSVRDGLSTVIADEIEFLYSPSQLQDGEDVRFSFESINQHMRDTGQDEQVNQVELMSSGDQLVMRGEFSGQNLEIAFVPEVTGDGRLQLIPVGDGGWFEDRMMDILGGGVESAMNQWLERNGLILTNVTLEPDGIVLSVEGN